MKSIITLALLAIVGYFLWPHAAEVRDRIPTLDTSTSSDTTVTRVVDGDTVELADGRHVRVVGIDTPERGECGYKVASRHMEVLVWGKDVALVQPGGSGDTDRYGRTLAYLDVAGKDAGLAQIKIGYATARYDSRDGYDRHPRQGRYVKADAATPNVCGR